MVSNRLFPKIHRTQWFILRKMISKEHWGFNEIKFEDMDPKKFTYHLKKLVQEELIAYDSGSKKYSLATNGKVLMDYFKDIPNFAELPINTTILLHVESDQRVLVVKRKRVPSLHYIGHPVGDTSLTESIQASAEKLLASFNLSGVLSLSLVMEMLYKEKSGEIFSHDMFYVFYGESIHGACAEECEEGELLWMDPKELLSVKKGYKNTKDLLDHFSNPNFDPKEVRFLSKSYTKSF